MPPPITRQRFTTSLVPACRGASLRSLATAVLASTMALAVASVLSLCIQEHCSRILAISTMYGLRPAPSAVLRKVASCMRGEQEHTAMPSSLYSFIAS